MFILPGVPKHPLVFSNLRGLVDELRQAFVAKERPPEIRYLEHLFNMLVPKNTKPKQEVWLDVNRGRVNTALKFTNVVEFFFHQKNGQFQ